MSAPMPPSNTLRLWPAYLILAAAVGALVWIWAPADSPGSMSQSTLTLIAASLATVLLLLWWLLLSRARWLVRVGVLVAVAALGGAAARFLEIRGVSGDLVPRLAWRGESAPALPAVSRTTLDAPPPELAGATEPTPAVEPTARPVPAARDFPQFLGPDRDATLSGVHLARGWERHAPVAVWRRPIGAGWSGFAVAGGLAVTQEQGHDNERVVAYDLASGEVRWSHRGGPGYRSGMTGDGPRATPTIDGGRVFAFGVDGTLRSLDLETGRLLFERDVLAENAGRAPDHGVASSPLAVDGLVIVLAGGPNGRSLVAYDTRTGEKRWAGGDDGAAYSSPLVATLGGVRQIVVFNLHHLTGHDPRTGEVLWQDDRWPDRPEKVSQPVILDDDRVFVSMGYGVGGRLVQVTRRSDGGLSAQVKWETRRLKAKFTQVVPHEGFLYGLDEGVLVCLDPADGERRWKQGRYGHGQILLVDDLLLVQAEDGEVILIDPNPERLVELARFQAVDGRTWATPALAGDLLIIRSDLEAACYRLPTEPGA